MSATTSRKPSTGRRRQSKFLGSRVNTCPKEGTDRSRVRAAATASGHASASTNIAPPRSPAWNTEAFQRKFFGGQRNEDAGNTRDDRDADPARGGHRRRSRQTDAPEHRCDEHQCGHQCAADDLPPPKGMIGDRLAPGELERAVVGVEQSPMPADGAFELPLPGLVERLDHIDAELVALWRAR